MAAVRVRDAGLWLARHDALVLLAVTTSGLAAGGMLQLAAAGIGDAVWLAGGLCGAGYSLWSIADGLRHGRMGVDVIALLALAGALAVGEYLAAAVISVTVASGRALEAWAAGRARRDLQALLERAPSTARRYRGGALESVPLEGIVHGDLLLVAAGEVVPVDGTVAGGPAVPERHGPCPGLSGRWQSWSWPPRAPLSSLPLSPWCRDCPSRPAGASSSKAAACWSA